MSTIKKLQEKIKYIDNQKKLTLFQSELLNLAEHNKINFSVVKELSEIAKEYLDFVEEHKRVNSEELIVNNGQNQEFETIDYSEYTDLELVEDGAFMPFLQYQYGMQWTHKMTQTMFNVYYCLCYHAKYGDVYGLSTQDIAKFIGHSSDSKVVKAIARLEQLKLIAIDRREIINSYIIIGYQGAILKGGKGGYVMPLEMFRKLQNYNLKHYRLVWYLVAHKHHMPNNTGKSGIKQGTLKRIVNAVSFKELRGLIKDLTGVIFRTIDNFWAKIKRALMKSLRLNFEFLQLGIGIVENTIENIENHHLYDKVKSILNRMRIDGTKSNIKKVIKKIENVSEFTFNEVENLSKKPHIFSKYNTVNCLLSLLESKDQALRVKS